MDTRPETNQTPEEAYEPTRRMAPAEKRRSASLGRVDRYILLEHLGTGGFGAVYRGRDQVTEIEVALKLVPSYLSDSPDELENIRENFRLVAKLRHPNIANVQHLHTIEYVDPVAETAVGVAPGDCFIVMDYVRGQTVASYRRGCPDAKIPFDEALRIAAQVAEGLDFAHSQNVMHRDIKPGNVLVNPEGEVKILDFGIAAQIRASMVSMTGQSRDTSGTPPYMPPEQWTGRPQGARADQYGLAVLFYEMVSGQVPFASVFETNDHAVMYNVVRTQPPTPIDGLTRSQNRALAKALSKDPNDRHESCAAFIRALGGRKLLRECHAHALRAAGPDALGPATQPRRETTSPALWLVIAAILLGFAGWGGLAAYRHYLDMDARDAADAHTARVREFRRERVQTLLQALQRAREEGEVRAAAQTLRQLRRLDPGNPALTEPGASAGEELSLAEIIPIRSEAEMKWNRIDHIDRGQGLGEIIDRGKAVLAAANMLYEAKEYRQAMARYQQLIEDHRRLQELANRRREAARQSDAARGVRSKALQAQADQHAPELMRGARELNESGRSAFQRGEFEKADRLWTAAAAQYAKATAAAKGIVAEATTRQAYEKALENTDRQLLHKHGGETWAGIQDKEGEARRLADAGDWDRAAELWHKARTDLPLAVAEAKELQATPAELPADGGLPAALREARAARAIAEADAAKTNGDWQAVLHHANEALSYAPDSQAAKKRRREALDQILPRLKIVAVANGREIEGARVSVGDIAENATTPLTLQLEPGRKYPIAVRINPHRLEERYAPFETVFQAHETGLKTLRAELPKVPVPPDVVEIRDARYPPTAELSPGSQGAQERQRTAVEQEFYLPLEVRTVHAEIRMRLIPAGSFLRRNGSVQEGDEETAAAGPLDTTVKVDISQPFYVSKYEITRSQWAAVMGDPAEPAGGDDENLPITDITWQQAVEFCTRLCALQEVEDGTYRLLREDEWDYACRAGTENPWYTGETEDDARRAGWYEGNSDGALHPVGELLPNAWGLYDCHGNAWEWCLDPYVSATDERTAESPSTNDTSYRVIRGGGFDSDIDTSRVTHRAKHLMSKPRMNLGFRIMRVLEVKASAGK